MNGFRKYFGNLPNEARSHLVTWMVILALALSGCAGAAPIETQVEPLMTRSTWRLVEQALAGAHHTQILVKDYAEAGGRMWVFSSKLDNGWAWVNWQETSNGFINTNPTGNVVAVRTWSGFVKWLKEVGYQAVPAAEAAKEIGAALSAWANLSLPTFLVVPGVDVTPEILDEYIPEEMDG